MGIEEEVKVFAVQLALETVVEVSGPGFFCVVIEGEAMGLRFGFLLANACCVEGAVGGSYVLLDVDWGDAECSGLVRETVAQIVFREEVAQRCLDTEKIVERVFVFHAVEAASSDPP